MLLKASWIRFLLTFCAVGPALFAQGTLQTLHTFAYGSSDGQAPVAPPTEVFPGVFVGAAQTLYQVTSAGAFTVIAAATGGFGGVLFPASDGFIYGFEAPMYPDTYSAAFKTDLSTLQIINSGLDGAFPQFGEDQDHQLYGLQFDSNAGHPVNELFSMTFDGTLTPISLALPADAIVVGSPIQGTGGNFFGMLDTEPDVGAWEIYKITPSGTTTTRYAFAGFQNKSPNIGEYPNGSLLALGRTFYGVNKSGGQDAGDENTGYGTVFAFDPSSLRTLSHSFICSKVGRKGKILLVG